MLRLPLPQSAPLWVQHLTTAIERALTDRIEAIQPASPVAELPDPTEGSRAFVNDADAPVFGSVVVGGGSTKVPVYGDGTDWRVG